MMEIKKKSTETLKHCSISLAIMKYFLHFISQYSATGPIRAADGLAYTKATW